MLRERETALTVKNLDFKIADLSFEFWKQPIKLGRLSFEEFAVPFKLVALERRALSAKGTLFGSSSASSW